MDRATRVPVPDNGRIFAAETVGTAVLLLGGAGTAVFAEQSTGSTVAVALAYGLSLLVMWYVVVRISGCHLNPAVTLGMYLARRVSGTHAVFAVLGQVVGAIGGAAIIYGVASGRDDFSRGQFDANLWTAPGQYFGLGSTIVVEIVFTALLVLVMLSMTARRTMRGVGGIVVGLALTMIYLVTIPVDNGGVNPARSLATALFADSSTDALQQLWAFIVFPLIGAVVGVVVFLMLDESRLEDTILGDVPGLTGVRDTLDRGADTVVDGLEEHLDGDDD